MLILTDNFFIVIGVHAIAKITKQYVMFTSLIIISPVYMYHKRSKI